MSYDNLTDFDFDLPENLIAQYPLAVRSSSRLLTIDVSSQKINHQRFLDFASFIKPGDLLILNNTKVIRARLFGKKESGGKIECLVERILSDFEALVHLRFSKPPRAGSQINFAETIQATVLSRNKDLFHLRFEGEEPLLNVLEKYGSLPLPSYMQRSSEENDLARYQTVYANQPGAVAAPTAGLHFDEAFLTTLKKSGIKIAYVTLHIGAGTFQPVRVNDLNQHIIHSEYLDVSDETCQAVNLCRAQGGRVFAVGTTVVRSLETAGHSGILAPYKGETRLFIRPGYRFRWVDGLLTNFHLPKSTLLMLVTAFGGYDLVMHAYQEAIKENYRFYSYGDAMLLLN